MAAQWPASEPDPKDTKLKKEILFNGDKSYLDWFYDVKAELQDFSLAHHISLSDTDCVDTTKSGTIKGQKLNQ